MHQLFRKRVKLLLAAMTVLPGAAVLAQVATGAQSAQSGVTAAVPGADRLTPSELEELVGPIALYPDPLLANVLAASVYPDEVAAAAAFIAGGGKAEQVDAKSWEDPVKAIAKIPEVIKMMGQYKDWTIAMGQAYLIQAKDVMDVIQTLRKKAQETGALKTSPQQQVVTEQQIIYIKPADPEIIYVPTYSPSVVYVQQPPSSSNAAAAGVVGFGLGVATGLILANNLDCDYHGGCVGYGYHGGGNNVDINVNNNVNVNNNRNTNISGNNVGNTTNVGNRVGNEGNAYAPNKSKSLATAQSNQLNQFKGGSTAANRSEVPGGRTGAANSANRTGAAAQSAARPDTNAARQSNAGSVNRTPQTPPKQRSESAYSGGKNTKVESQRGAASRSGSGSGVRGGGSGGGRSGGGGGGRGR